MDSTHLPICPHCGEETNDNEVPLSFKFNEHYKVTCENCGRKFGVRTVEALEYHSYLLSEEDSLYDKKL